MRYVIAMIFAAAFAAACTVFVANPVAGWVVDSFKYDNPDQVGDLHAAVFMGVNLIGMLIGWTVGWALGRSFSAAPDLD